MSPHIVSFPTIALNYIKVAPEVFTTDLPASDAGGKQRYSVNRISLSAGSMHNSKITSKVIQLLGMPL